MNNKTRWVVKINNQKTKRVLIEYFPLKNKFIFSGQLKVVEIWYTFSIRKVKLGRNITGHDELNQSIFEIATVDNIDIDDNILKVYAELETKVANYNFFTKRMEEYKDSFNKFACKISDESEIALEPEPEGSN